MKLFRLLAHQKPGPLVLVEREDLVRELLRDVRLHGEVAVEDVVDLGAVLQEEPVPDRLIADAVADDQVVRAVDGDPAVAAVPDRGADDRAAAHRVAEAVEVEAVLAEHPLLAQVAELGVGDRPGRAPVVHGVAPDAARVGRLDDDVAAQVRHLAAVVAGAEVLELQGPVEGQAVTAEGDDGAFLGEDGDARLGIGPVAAVALLLRAWRVAGLPPPRAAGAVVAPGGRDDHPVAGPPAGDGLGEGHGGAPRRRRGPELDPGAVHRGAVEVHPAAAADDGRAGLPVHPLDVGQADRGGVLAADRAVGGADLQRGPGPARDGPGLVPLAIEAVLARVVAGLDLDQAHGQAGVAVGGEGERPGDVDRSDDLVGGDVIDDGVSPADLHPRPGGRDFPPLPGRRRRPGAALSGSDEVPRPRRAGLDECRHEGADPDQPGEGERREETAPVRSDGGTHGFRLQVGVGLAFR